MARLILFRDLNPLHRPDKSGYNKVGYLSRSKLIVYRGFRMVRRKPFDRVGKYRYSIVETTAHFDEEAVEAFFLLNHLHPSLFDDGLVALRDAHPDFFEYAVRLPVGDVVSPEERDSRWQALLSILKPGDLIATFDTQSRMSRLISFVDGGPWSHMGVYVGNGRIAEALTRGVVERGIEAYQPARYRLGVYRPVGMTPEGAERVVAACRSRLGAAYNYTGVLRVGSRLLFRIEAGRERFPSPTEMALAEGLRLIHIV
jgi:hypothetical protein